MKDCLSVKSSTKRGDRVIVRLKKVGEEGYCWRRGKNGQAG